MKKMKIYFSAIVLVMMTLTSFSQTYKETKIGSQIWMVQNLNVDKFQNGDAIPHAKTDEDWKKALRDDQPAWCYYDNDPANETKYGKLYNWYAVNDPRGIAPKGWHVASINDWESLKKNLGEEAEKKMKATSDWASYSTGGAAILCPNCIDWSSEYRKKVPCHTCKDTRKTGKNTPIVEHSGNGTNSSGFSALPGGKRNDHSSFNTVGEIGYWWTSSKASTNYAYSIFLEYNNIDVRVYQAFSSGEGFSVRCVKGEAEIKKEAPAPSRGRSGRGR